MSRVWTLWTLGSKGQRSRSQCKDDWKWFLAHITASPLHLSLWNFHTSLPSSQVCALWNLGSKGQRSRSQCKDYWKWFLAHNCFPFTPIVMKLHMQSPHESIMDPMDFGGQKVKGQGHKARITEKGFWRITASLYTYVDDTFTCSLPMSRVWTLWTLGSKGQRSRSQCKDYWKRFLAHNCFPNLVHNLESLNWLPRGVFCPVRTAPF